MIQCPCGYSYYNSTHRDNCAKCGRSLRKGDGRPTESAIPPMDVSGFPYLSIPRDPTEVPPAPPPEPVTPTFVSGGGDTGGGGASASWSDSSPSSDSGGGSSGGDSGGGGGGGGSD